MESEWESRLMCEWCVAIRALTAPDAALLSATRNTGGCGISVGLPGSAFMGEIAGRVSWHVMRARFVLQQLHRRTGQAGDYDIIWVVRVPENTV